MIFDEQGTIVSTLAVTSGGMAWSSDSKRLYYAAIDPKAETVPPYEVRRNWLNTAEQEAAQPKEDADGQDDESELSVNVWEDGSARPLFLLEKQAPWYMALSPDQNWLALVTMETGGGETVRLYVFSLASKRLYPLSIGCGRTVCFTGPNRLAFIEANEVRDGQPSEIGVLTEVLLDEQTEKLNRQPLAVVLMMASPWIQPLGEDVLLTSFSFTFPAAFPQADLTEDNIFTLHRYVRADKAIKPLVEGVGQLFMPNPDGSLVLIEKILHPADKAHRESKLAVFEPATGAVHVLADATVAVVDPSGAQQTGAPAYAAWRGSREISFVSPIDSPKPLETQGNRYYTNLGLYQLTADFRLKLIRTLSETWPLEVKPSFKGN